jgi:hypothetical protein
VHTHLGGDRRDIINRFPCVRRVWNAKPKLKIKAFDEFVSKIMPFNHPKVVHWFRSNTKSQSMAWRDKERRKGRGNDTRHLSTRFTRMDGLEAKRYGLWGVVLSLESRVCKIVGNSHVGE